MRLAGDIFRRKAPAEISSALLGRPLVAPDVPVGKLLKYGIREERLPSHFGQVIHEYMQASGQV